MVVGSTAPKAVLDLKHTKRRSAYFEICNTAAGQLYSNFKPVKVQHSILATSKYRSESSQTLGIHSTFYHRTKPFIYLCNHDQQCLLIARFKVWLTESLAMLIASTEPQLSILNAKNIGYLIRVNND